jgi:hypothetical protein
MKWKERSIRELVETETWVASEGDIREVRGWTVFNANHVVDRIGPEPFHLVRAAVGASAPEALRLLLQVEFVFGPGGNRSCPWCQKVITPAGLHTDTCPWLELMKKVGLK